MSDFLPLTIGDSSYAKNAVKYIEILNKLRRMGAQSAVDLPTVVFCGNQSAGKSSLLEAISGIQVKKKRKFFDFTRNERFYFFKINTSYSAFNINNFFFL